MTQMGTSSRNEQARQEYFLWLCDKVGAQRFHSDQDRRELLLWLHSKEFTWSIPKDENRAADGLNLRRAYSEETKPGEYHYLVGPCSVLEMMAALAQRIEYILQHPRRPDRTSQWFWEMVDNLDLWMPSKDLSGWTDHNERQIQQLLNRTYADDGNGGLFPLRWTNRDQRNEEIWQQMMMWLNQMHPE